MQPRDYWKVISKRWWIVALVALAAVAGSVLYSRYVETPMYRSTVRLDVSPSRYDYGLTLVVDNLLRQYAAQMQTDKLAATISDRLQLDLSAERLRGKIKVSSIPEDYALEMQVDDPDPNRARDIAFTWADEFIREHQVLMAPIDPRDRINITLHDKPRPGTLSSPQTRQNAIAAGILGLVFGLLLLFLLEYLDDTLKTPEDVERYLKTAAIAAIPAESTEGARGESGGTKTRPSAG